MNYCLEIQMIASNALVSVKNPLVSRVKLELMTFTELYEICSDENLWDINLLIIHASSIDDSDVLAGMDARIARLWRSILFRYS